MLKHLLEKETLTIYLDGELNSVNAEHVSNEMDKVIEGKVFQRLVLDLKDLSYISSAGLRVVLRLRNQFEDFSIINVSTEVLDVFQMTGFTSLMPIHKMVRSVDVTNAEIIGEGYFSTVYRLDKETVVKVYNQTSDPNQIERELSLAKEAFVLGIPTAISYDIVNVGSKKGVCFELLDCMSLQQALVQHPEQKKEYIKKYADLIKTINTTECQNSMIPDIKKAYLDKVEDIKPLLEKKEYVKLKKLISSIPGRKTFVHGDCHLKNVMVQNGELLLIDMDTFSVGHPIFELAALYASYIAYNEDDHENCKSFFGISFEEAVEIYAQLIEDYFGKNDTKIEEKIKLVCYTQMVWDGRKDPGLDKALGRLRNYLSICDDLEIGI